MADPASSGMHSSPRLPSSPSPLKRGGSATLNSQSSGDAARTSSKRKATTTGDRGEENEGDESDEDEPARKKARVLVEATQPAAGESSMDAEELDAGLANISSDEDAVGQFAFNDEQVSPESEQQDEIVAKPQLAAEAGPSRLTAREEEEDELMNGNEDQYDEDEDMDLKPELDSEEDEQDNEDDMEEYQDEEGNTHLRPKRHVRVPFERGADGYVSGSILRVRCKNFVTYDFVEFTPGPHLNMIIGPNGTGKSTIVCAIALGLGFAPKTLGRATEINGYAKQGADSGSFTEITLKSRGNQPNLVIKREFTRVDNKSKFYINGQVATAQIVHQRVRELDIQVDNLCAFLPQDKVAEFANMSPEVLLAQTMLAAGDASLPKWHADLIKDGKTFFRVQQDLTEQQRLLTKTERTIEELQPEEERMNLKRELEKKIKVHEVAVVYKQYDNAKLSHDAAKTALQGLERRTADLRAKMTPLDQLQTEMQKRLDAANKKINEGTSASIKIRQAADAVTPRFEDLVVASEGLVEKMENAKEKERSRKADIIRAEKERDMLQQTVDAPPPNVDLAPIERQRRTINEKMNELKKADREMEDQIGNVGRRGTDIQRLLTIEAKKLETFQDTASQRRQKFAAADPHSAYAMNWIDQNRHRFEKEVCFPPAVSVTVSDPGFAPSVEACLSFTQMKTFICQTHQDYDLLNELNDGREHTIPGYHGGKVRISVIMISPEDLDPSQDKRPLTHEQLASYNLEGYAIDFCQADPAVMAFLRTSCRLDSAAVGRELILGDGVEASGLTRIHVWDPDFPDPDDHNPNPQKRRKAPKGFSTQIVISRYGKRGQQSSTNQMSPARFFGEIVDKVKLAECVRANGQLTQQRLMLEEEAKKLTAGRPKRKDDMEKMQGKIRELDEQKKQAAKDTTRYEKAKVDLEQTKIHLRRLQNQPSADAQRARYRKELYMNVRQRADLVAKEAELCDKAAKLVDRHLDSNLLQLQAQANVNAIQIEANNRSGKLLDLQASVAQAKAEKDRVHLYAKALFEKLKERLESEEIDRARCIELGKENTLQALEDQLVSLETEHDMLPDLDRSVAQRLKQAKLKRKELTGIVAIARGKFDKLDTRMKVTKANFEPAIKQLVRVVGDKFGSAMETLRCAGEVSLRQDERDYEKWALELKVKFRDEEELQILDRHRQSGGERSLSTIMYLMSLTDLARTPFSLVDEINQGMDQRAERAVHDHLVRTTCQPDGGQYFLITPKLLTDLDYHEMMKVLIINNGEWLPDPDDGTSHGLKIGNLAACIAAYPLE